MNEVIRKDIPVGILSNIGGNYLFAVRLQIKKALKKAPNSTTELWCHTQHVEIGT